MIMAWISSLCCSTFRAFIIRTHTASIIIDLSFCTSASRSPMLFDPTPSFAIFAALTYGNKLSLRLLFSNLGLTLICSFFSNVGFFGFCFRSTCVLGLQSRSRLYFRSFSLIWQRSSISETVRVSFWLKRQRMAVWKQLTITW